MKIIAKSVVAAAIGLAASSALAESSVFPTSIDDAPALSIAGTTHADRYGTELAPARERGVESRWLPAWARGSERAQLFNPQIADG